MSESLFGGNNNYNYEDDNLKEYPKENSNTKLLPNEVDKYLDGWKLEEDSVGIYYKHPCSTEKFGAIRIIFEDGTSEYVPKYNVNLETVYIAIKNKRPCINVELKYLQSK